MRVGDSYAFGRFLCFWEVPVFAGGSCVCAGLLCLWEVSILVRRICICAMFLCLWEIFMFVGSIYARLREVPIHIGNIYISCSEKSTISMHSTFKRHKNNTI